MLRPLRQVGLQAAVGATQTHRFFTSCLRTFTSCRRGTLCEGVSVPQVPSSHDVLHVGTRGPTGSFVRHRDLCSSVSTEVGRQSFSPRTFSAGPGAAIFRQKRFEAKYPKFVPVAGRGCSASSRPWLSLFRPSSLVVIMVVRLCVQDSLGALRTAVDATSSMAEEDGGK